MNEQRRVIYAYRDEVLEGKSIGEEARREVSRVIERTVEDYTPGDFMEDWDLDAPVRRARAAVPASNSRAADARARGDGSNAP